jgi:hypothetical protein
MLLRHLSVRERPSDFDPNSIEKVNLQPSPSFPFRLPDRAVTDLARYEPVLKDVV